MEEHSVVLREIPLGLLSDDAAFQFRQELFLRDLVENIQMVGHKVPITVRALHDGRYQIIYGFRRVQALRELGYQTVRAIVHEDLSEEEALQERFAENSERDEYSPFEWVKICEELEARGYTRARIGQIIGRSPTSVSRYFQVLSHPEVLEALRTKELSFREALRHIATTRSHSPGADDGETVPAEETAMPSARTDDPDEAFRFRDTEDVEEAFFSGEAKERPPWDTSDGGETSDEFLEPQEAEGVSLSFSALPPEDGLKRLARLILRTISETPFSRLPEIRFRVLSPGPDGETGPQPETPAVDIMGLEVERLLPFLERLRQNVREAGLEGKK